MAPVAFGFLILIATAAVTGALVGAIGGALVWRLRLNAAAGIALTVCAFLGILLLDQWGDTTWLRAKLAWGIPSLAVTFLSASLSARWVAARTRLSPTWTAIVACVLALSLGFLYMFLFKLSPGAPLVGGPAISLCLILLLVLSRRLVQKGRPS
jgi:hypothetical protein